MEPKNPGPPPPHLVAQAAHAFVSGVMPGSSKEKLLLARLTSAKVAFHRTETNISDFNVLDDPLLRVQRFPR